MSRRSWGALCDVKGCGSVAIHGQDEALIYCPVCERDLCADCQQKTGHQQTVWPDVDQAPEVSCDPEDWDPNYVNSPTDHWRMKEAR